MIKVDKTGQYRLKYTGKILSIIDEKDGVHTVN